jgi:hypothetical protein
MSFVLSISQLRAFEKSAPRFSLSFVAPRYASSRARQFFYAVRVGHKPGIYTRWEGEAKEYTEGESSEAALDLHCLIEVLDRLSKPGIQKGRYSVRPDYSTFPQSRWLIRRLDRPAAKAFMKRELYTRKLR